MSHYVFPKTVLPIEGESLYGYVKRVASFYGWSQLGSFLDVIGVSNIHQVNWFVISPVTERIIDNLAKSMQLDNNQLCQQLFPKETYSLLSLNKRLYGSHALRRIRVCPLCINEGTSHQLHWQHVANGYCENHQCELVSECQHCDSAIQIEYGVNWGSCFKSLLIATDNELSITSIITKLSKSEQLELMTAIESVITMLQSDSDVFNWRKFIEKVKPYTLANLYLEGFLFLTNDKFKDKWLAFMASKRQDFSALGEKAVNLPFSKVSLLRKPLLRKIKLVTSEQERKECDNRLPDFSLMDNSIGNVLSEKDISYFCGIRKSEFSSLSKAYSIIHPARNSIVLYNANKLIEVIRNITIPASDDMVANTDLISFNAKELTLLKFSGLNKIDLLTHASSNNIPVYMCEQPKGTLLDQLHIMKSDLFNILLNNINVEVSGVSETKLASMFGTTTSKIDVMVKCGLIKHKGEKIDSTSVNDFFDNFEVLNRIGRIQKINIKKLVHTFAEVHDLRPAFAFKTEKLDVAYIFSKTEKFTEAINKMN
jgi:hypothetical protein